ncbi:PAS domain-containing protein [Tabrizicola piscis]|uniref:histidine kinase n=1 Tax=Tabrizicola piscis TaxID=2494374 RepID=A0A3S8U7M1_9RHOB|nr:HWE histidine kinase domain-containing protein [Tabrizicola piscis]AZL59568.1 PAS domain-containing protein [Tabrizicola piscis]
MNIDDLYRQLRSGHVQAQGIVDTISHPLVVLDARLCVQSANRTFFETFNVDGFETIGKPIYELGTGQWDIPELRRLLGEIIPRATAVIDYEVETYFPDLGQRTMLITARAMTHSGGPRGILLSIIDATDQVQRDLAKDILYGEMRHRVRNLLTIAEVLARTTTTAGRTAEQYRDTFLGRFRSLTQAHEIALGGPGGLGLRRVIECILAPYTTATSVLIEGGPEVDLESAKLVTLSLVFHELATNAAKYGALSVPEGRVAVHWEGGEAEGALRIHWVETGGPPVSPRVKKGHGTMLIASSVEYTLAGHLDQRFLTEGLQVDLTIPIPMCPAGGEQGHAKDRARS